MDVLRRPGMPPSPDGGSFAGPATAIGVHFFTQPDLSRSDRLFRRHADGTGYYRPDHSDYYTVPMIALRKALQSRGVMLHTSDVAASKGGCGCMIVIDLPARRGELLAFKRRFPEVRFWIFVKMESPVVVRALLAENLAEDFDWVVTYGNAPNGCRFSRYALPVLERHGEGRTHCEDIPFASRKLLVMINSNRRRGWSDYRNLPLALQLRGWRAGLHAQLRILGEEDGYARRRNLARIAARHIGDGFDLYGRGWSGEPVIWWNRLAPNRPNPRGAGLWQGDNIALMRRYRFAIAYENWVGNPGYVSEKLFLPMLAGAVPVYLGACDIEDHVPRGAYVDRRDFGSEREMLSFLSSCSRTDWNEFRDAANTFLRSPRSRDFHSDSLLSALCEALREAGIELSA